MVREHRARRNPVLARRQPILLWNGQGQQHHQRAFTDRANRAGGHRTFFHYRPADAMGDARWVGSPTRWPPIWNWKTQSIAALCRSFGPRRESRSAPASKR